ncbi:MAG: hypothetical protein NWR72_12650 [Bacteroidia bacterium]|nr:hypothetical protein [Bacteroidia bacterium]
MKSISPDTLKHAITEAYNLHNPDGKRELAHTLFQVIRHGLSFERGNPWRDILSHWGEQHKRFQEERSRLSHFSHVAGHRHGAWGCGGRNKSGWKHDHQWTGRG